ncbi:MAG: cytochrome P450 [Aquabacterium sp.]
MSTTAAAPPALPAFNPLSPAFIRDPYPFYDQLRRHAPMLPSPFGGILASRHADISFVLRDKRFGKDFVNRISGRLGPQILDEPVYRSMRHWMLTQDPPDHTRLRGLVVKAFTARRVEDMRPRIQAIVDATLDRVAARGHMDLIEEFAFRLPVIVICDMLGIPEEDHEIFFQRERTGGRLLDPVPLSRAEIDEANTAHHASTAYFQGLFERRRREPGDDLTTQLVQAEEDGSKLSNEELTANIILLFGAGHETTVNLIGNGLLALHRHPDQLALLKQRPELMSNAVEEFLRYDSSVQMTSRVALEDMPDVGGRHVHRGESVMCLLGSANRDPAAYPDHPDRLDITRPNIRPQSFGGGIHFCLGAQLARIEAEVAIGTLLRRLPGLTLDDADHPDWRPTFVLRGLKHLPARWAA